MPPKAKFTKEQIVAAALEIVRRDGTEELTARNLGAELDSSARPIFTVFENMDEVKSEMIKSAKKLYRSYVERGLSENSAFKGVGTEYIRFACEEPKLFQLLFMSERNGIPKLSDVLSEIDDSYEEILSSVENGYGLCREKAERLYLHLWIYTHGIATLCATKVCRFTSEQISEMMTEVFVGLLQKIKGDKAL